MDLETTENRTVSKNQILSIWIRSLPAPGTRRNYSCYMKRFISQSGLDPFTLNSFELDEYLIQAMGKGIRNGSLRLQVIALNSFYRYMGVKKPGYPNPVRKKTVVVPYCVESTIIKIRKRALTPEQIYRVLNQFHDQEIKTGREPTGAFLFRFLINTGMRIKEALSLEFFDPGKDRDEYTNYLRIENGRGYILVMGKGNRPREFYLNREFTKYLTSRKLVAGERILQNRTGRPLAYSSAFQQMKVVAKRYLKGADVYKFSPHSLRHTYCTLQVKNDENPINIAKVVGNSAAMIEKTYLSEPKDINANYCFL